MLDQGVKGSNILCGMASTNFRWEEVFSVEWL